MAKEMATFRVLEDCLQVMSQASRVAINFDGVTRLAASLIQQGIKRPPWNDMVYWHGNEKETLLYMMVLECVNFLSWHPEAHKRWLFVDGKGREWSGWYGSVLAVHNDLVSSRRLLDVEFLRSMTETQFEEIFAGKGEWLLKEQRLAHMRELGEVLTTRYLGQAEKLLEEVNYDAVRLIQRVVDLFPSLRDVCTYGTQSVAFYKRAQHLAIMVWSLWPELYGKQLTRMEELTVLPDNRVPQLLRHLGVLEYEKDLSEKVDAKILLAPGSEEEVEIRAATVVAGNLICEELMKRESSLLSVELDVNLWLLGERLKSEMLPAHRVISVNY